MPTAARIREVGHWNNSRELRFGDVWAEGDFAYIGRSYDGGGVDIIDVSDPSRPMLTSTWESPDGYSRSQDVKVSNGIGYFGAESGSGVYVVDLLDAYNPTTLSVIDASNGGVDRFHNVFIEGIYLYVVDNETPRINVFDVSDPAHPFKVQTITVPGVPKIHDVTVLRGRLYASGGHLMTIYDVTDISRPVELVAFITGQKTHSAWPTEDGNYLAVSNEVPGGSIAIWDIHRVDTPQLIARLDPHELGFGDVSAHNPVIMGGVLYVSWLTAGLKLFSLADPTDPTYLGGFTSSTRAGTQPTGGGVWGVYPFLGHDIVLASDEAEGLWIVDASQLAGS